MSAPTYLNALRAFEAAARHQSFSAAAAELHVTSAAVGQQVRTLESWLGVTLFNRASSGSARLVLTDVARKALPDIREGFERLGVGLARLKEGSLSTGLTVTVSPAFAAKWLLPRIERFQLAHPQTDVLLDTNLRPLDFIAEGMDIGVRYGAGRWPGLTAIKLMDEEMYPVCAPGYPLLENGRLPPARLVEATLIHDLSMAGDPAYPTWRTWLDASGYGDINAEHGLRINNSAAVLQAAIDGQGLALGRSVMLREDLAAGRLIRPFGEASHPLAFAYYIVYRPEAEGLAKIQAFRDWLLEQVSPAIGV
ncbi:transcriptional regulator GcvA [Pseudomonas gingeri]|uniref:Transcriptional regulator GcvA n=1 Tax=Pseudomonas gingeri TaxID=117681 RepID=A0A7Y7YD29_9PSED|nr:transcriptional regulator GcvA [Pseudomonas gingeri]NWA02281.1 transcriptional regulator GcvA [Pseudomonas gingeri]NWA12546.1 transcriptional regulator GcvA [Pseudomonas gingeri]NWA57048.1 transcriptional regulator GcvA [Pseudomonas gingeri]NWA93391.1 transcriptional regulator GcvA [Pseudomonas gingeri]NWB02863.1 transcriptional regulator GcvA [Pseudomonas gingeri]